MDALQERLKQTQSKFNATKDELKTAKSNYALIKSQYQHEIRKKSRDLDKLKERLNKMVQDSSVKVKMGMTLLNPLPKSVSVSALDKKENPDEQMYEIVVANYEEREKEILVENQALKDFLYSLYQSMNLGCEKSLNESVFQMPFELSKCSIQKEFSSSSSSVELESTSQSTQLKALHEQELKEKEWLKEKAKLELKCNQLQKTMDEQNEMMELLLKQEQRPVEDSL